MRLARIIVQNPLAARLGSDSSSSDSSDCRNPHDEDDNDDDDAKAPGDHEQSDDNTDDQGNSHYPWPRVRADPTETHESAETREMAIDFWREIQEAADDAVGRGLIDDAMARGILSTPASGSGATQLPLVPVHAPPPIGPAPMGTAVQALLALTDLDVFLQDPLATPPPIALPPGPAPISQPRRSRPGVLS